MKKAFEILKLITLIIIITSITSSCFVLSKRKFNENQYMQICAYFSVPIKLPNDIKNVTDLNCNIEERDSKGRVLFTLNTYNSCNLQHETYMIICQKHDLNYIYYYEDQSYLMPGYSDFDVELLKTANDWDKELDETKMSRREINLTFDGIINAYTYITKVEIYNICQSKLGISEECITYCAVIDGDGTKNIIYSIKAEIDSKTYTYYVMCNTDSEAFIWEPENGEFTPSEYAKFKRENGWVYGFN